MEPKGNPLYWPNAMHLRTTQAKCMTKRYLLMANGVISVSFLRHPVADWWYCDNSIRRVFIRVGVFLPLSLGPDRGSFLRDHCVTQFRSFWWMTKRYKSSGNMRIKSTLLTTTSVITRTAGSTEWVVYASYVLA